MYQLADTARRRGGRAGWGAQADAVYLGPGLDWGDFARWPGARAGSATMSTQPAAMALRGIECRADLPRQRRRHRHRGGRSRPHRAVGRCQGGRKAQGEGGAAGQSNGHARHDRTRIGGACGTRGTRLNSCE